MGFNWTLWDSIVVCPSWKAERLNTTPSILGRMKTTSTYFKIHQHFKNCDMSLKAGEILMDVIRVLCGWNSKFSADEIRAFLLDGTQLYYPCFIFNYGQNLSASSSSAHTQWHHYERMGEHPTPVVKTSREIRSVFFLFKLWLAFQEILLPLHQKMPSLRPCTYRLWSHFYTASGKLPLTFS